MSTLKLYMTLIGCKPTGRHTEQHDFFFGIASSLKELIPELIGFWPEAEGKMHLDGWREVTTVDGYQVSIVPRGTTVGATNKLFFINLGGYQPNRFEEQHYTLLTVKPDYAQALKEAKETLFFKHNRFDTASSHVDDKYGIDVDDLYQIEDILSSAQKELYEIALTSADGVPEDELHLGYFKLALL